MKSLCPLASVFLLGFLANYHWHCGSFICYTKTIYIYMVWTAILYSRRKFLAINKSYWCLWNWSRSQFLHVNNVFNTSELEKYKTTNIISWYFNGDCISWVDQSSTLKSSYEAARNIYVALEEASKLWAVETNIWKCIRIRSWRFTLIYSSLENTFLKKFPKILFYFYCFFFFHQSKKVIPRAPRRM